MPITTIDGMMLKEMFLSGAALLEKNRQNIDALNVFPVPDGDTGTNMSHTIASAMKEMTSHTCSSAAHVSSLVAKGALKGARGNSGVILSQIFRGISKGLEGCEEIDAAAFVRAIRMGADTAYKAVMKPKEGTILTVARVIAEEVEREEDHVREFKSPPETDLPIAPLHLIVGAAQQVVRRDAGVLQSLRDMPFENRVRARTVAAERHPLQRRAVDETPPLGQFEIIPSVQIVIDFVVRVAPLRRLPRLRHGRYAPCVSADAGVLGERHRRVHELRRKRPLVDDRAACVIGALNIGERRNGNAPGQVGKRFRAFAPQTENGRAESGG